MSQVLWMVCQYVIIQWKWWRSFPTLVVDTISNDGGMKIRIAKAASALIWLSEEIHINFTNAHLLITVKHAGYNGSKC